MPRNIHLTPFPPFKRSGTTITQRTSGDKLSSTGDIEIVDGKKLLLGTGNDGEIYSSSDDLYIVNVTSDKDIIFRGNDGGVATDILKLDVSAGQLSGIIKSVAGVATNAVADTDYLLNIVADTTPQLGAALDCQTYGMTNVGSLVFTTGNSIASGSTNGNTMLLNANDTTFITLTTGATDTCAISGAAIDNCIIGAGTAVAITGTTITANTGVVPDANDGAYLGQAGTAFSDLFLAEGGVINWDSGDVTITQTGSLLDIAGGNVGIGAAANSSVRLNIGWNAETMPAATTASRQVQTGGNITELVNATITDICGAYFNTFTITDGGGTETVAQVSTVYIPNAPTVGTTPAKGPYALFVDAGEVRIDGSLGDTTDRVASGFFTDLTVTNAITGSITGNAATVTGFTPASGSLTLSGADALTLTTTADTNVTLPTTGTLLANVVEDTTPQLGGALDCQENDIDNVGDIIHDDATASDWTLKNIDQDKDIIFNGNDGGVDTVIMKLDVSEGQLSGIIKATTGVLGAAAAGTDYYAPGGTDVAVADGGTGASSFTAYAVLCGGTTSTNPIQAIAGVGTSGQVLTSNGAGALPTFQAAAAGSARSLSWYTDTTATRTGNTTVTITGGSDAEAKLLAGNPITWKESTVQKKGVIVSASNSSGTITLTIIGDVCASIDASSFKIFKDYNIYTSNISMDWYLTGEQAADASNPQGKQYIAPCDMFIPFCSAWCGSAPTGSALTMEIYDDGGAITSNLSIAATATSDEGNANTTTIAADSRITVRVTAVGSTLAGSDLNIIMFAVPDDLYDGAY